MRKISFSKIKMRLVYLPKSDVPTKTATNHPSVNNLQSCQMQPPKIPISPTTRLNVSRIGQHEAAHHVIARIFGLGVGEISVTITDSRGGHIAGHKTTLATPVTTVDQIVDYLEKRVIVLYSGSLGESLTNGKINNELALATLRDGGGRNDYDKARELIQLMRNITCPNAIKEDEIQAGLTAIDSDLWNRAAVYVEAEHAIIVGLGRNLTSRLEFFGEPAILPLDEIDAMPAIQERFGRKSDQTAA
jgi:hypothetical protein